MKPSPTGEAQEVKVKVRINSNGIVLISNAQMVEKKEVVEEGNAEPEQPQSPTEAAPGQEGTGGEPMDTQDVSEIAFILDFLVGWGASGKYAL